MIASNETRRVYFNVLSSDRSGGRCNATLIIWSRENAYAFTDTMIIVKPAPPLIPALTKVNLLMLLLIFMAILYVARKSEQKEQTKRRRRKRTTEEKVVRIILYLIASIVIFFIIYHAFNYFGGFPQLI